MDSKHLREEMGLHSGNVIEIVRKYNLMETAYEHTDIHQVQIEGNKCGFTCYNEGTLRKQRNNDNDVQTKCNGCDFMCNNIITLQKHINTKRTLIVHE